MARYPAPATGTSAPGSLDTVLSSTIDGARNLPIQTNMGVQEWGRAPWEERREKNFYAIERCDGADQKPTYDRCVVHEAILLGGHRVES